MKSFLLRTLLIIFILLLCLTIFFLIPEEKKLIQVEQNAFTGFEELKSVRVLCWIMTAPATRIERALHIQNTWGKRCDKLLLMSSRTDNETENVIALPVDEGRENLWRKARAAFEYVYKHHYDEADWFMKADDDTYVVMDNLRYMLYPYSHTFPIHFGYRFSPYTKQGYMAGASVVLSKEALKRFMNDPDKDSPCNQDIETADDVQIGVCMDKIGVLAGDSRDEIKSERFLPMEPEFFIVEHGFDAAPWLADFMYYNDTESMDTVSDTAIAFHYVKPQKMYLFEYLIYHLRPVGVRTGPSTLPKKLTFKEVLTKLRDAESDKPKRKEIEVKTEN